MPKLRTPGLIVGAAIVAAALAPSSGQAVGGARAAACTPVKNVEAIIDDSGSMIGTDSNRLRVQAVDLLINALPDGTQLGAIQFGSSFDPATPSASVVFPAEAIGPNAAAMKSALDTQIQGDDGGTDYNAAFETGRAANPGAAARIFLTDGGHNSGEYNNTHLNPPPQGQTPTYVIGFSAGLVRARRSGTADQDRQRHRRPLLPAAGRQRAPVGDERDRDDALVPDAAEDVQRLARAGQDQGAHGEGQLQVQVGAARPLVDEPARQVHDLRHQDRPKGHVVAKSAKKHKKPKKLKVKVKTGSTFAVIKVSRLVKGTLKFKVKAATIGSGAPKVTLTTQVSQSRRR